MVRASLLLSILCLAGCAAPPPPAPAATSTTDARGERLELMLVRTPENPFAGAAVGDWWAYRVTSIDGDDDPIVVRQGTLLWQVVAVHGEDVVVQAETDFAGLDVWEGRTQRVFDRQDAPTLLTFLSLGVSSVSDVAIARDERVREVAGERRPCRGVSVALLTSGPLQLPVDASLWFCPDLGGALVSFSARALGRDDHKLRLDLLGAGSATAVRVGERPTLRARG
jgi:hypothetical protein